jgi:tRNA-uridine 2-sulfurtransferase
VVIGSEAELGGRWVRLEELNWLAEPLASGESCEVQIRHRGTAAPAVVTQREGESLELTLNSPLRAITPGQSGVLYDVGGRVLGGGVIT